MKKVIVIFFTLMIVMIAGCNDVDTDKANTQEQNIFYFGEGEKWFATYTVSKVSKSYFDSLYIQYIKDHNNRTEETTIGDIEYVLKAGNWTSQSSYPQSLKGVRNFHTASEMNAEAFDFANPEEVVLEISWQDKKETITLKKQ
ncbi:hypothetical protein [Chengkuizengella axinellae]|uniref:Uncharacterized protein n=1 Tax=Chengkuizengella axinellae TaxID=3064388 RepID=A0ABT9J030_9BACL|nr:hypothetical protein [Chengkuizengella sp. 2205SS18-9]MDP5274938.1 hypothetical protein [Chengkuizengella sp. 2205SS18-9]